MCKPENTKRKKKNLSTKQTIVYELAKTKSEHHSWAVSIILQKGTCHPWVNYSRGPPVPPRRDGSCCICQLQSSAWAGAAPACSSVAAALLPRPEALRAPSNANSNPCNRVHLPAGPWKCVHSEGEDGWMPGSPGTPPRCLQLLDLGLLLQPPSCSPCRQEAGAQSIYTALFAARSCYAMNMQLEGEYAAFQT